MALWKFRKRKKRKNWPRRFLIAGLVLALFTVAGFYGAPPVVKAQLEKRATAALGRPVTVGKVRVNPYALSLTLDNLEVREADDSASFLGWKRLYVNFDPVASLRGAWTLGEIELDGFRVSARLQPDGKFNFADIVARLQQSRSSSGGGDTSPPPVRIGSLKVSDARVHFADHTQAQPFATVLGPLTFTVSEFRTAGARRGAPYDFEAVTEAGERLSWTGTLNANPLSSVGELRLENILLSKYAPYYAERVRADLTDGKLFLRGRYEFNLAEGAHVMRLVDGALQLRGVKVTERGRGEPLLELAALDVAGVMADALARKAVVESVTFTGGTVRARRENDGTLNLLSLLPPAGSGAAAPAAAASPAPVPDIMIRELALRDFAVELNDLAAPRPAHLAMGNIQFSLKNATLAEGASMPLALSLDWSPQGTIKLDGNVAIQPELKAELKVEAGSLAILPLSPYLEEFVNARITQGAISSEGVVQLTGTTTAPAAAFDGSMTLEKFGLVDGAFNEALAGVGALQLQGVKAATAPLLSVVIAEVNVSAPYARVLVNREGTLNLAALARGGNEEKNVRPSGEPGEAGATPLPKIEIGQVVIDGGDFTLTDRSLEPGVHMGVKEFGGTIRGLSSDNVARAGVELTAKVDGNGPVTVTGQLDPLGTKKFVDLKIDVRNVDLLPLSPYSGKFAGYELARGQATLDVRAKLDGRRLEAANVITLNQFTFGAPVASPVATKLPVRLGVALLKDASGQIVIDVPMSGDVDDPNLRIGKVVWRVVGNLLTKAATSPFALLGSMFGGGGDELAYQEFFPGHSDLAPAEVKKLETMVKALNNRPGLSVALEGGYDGAADAHALRQQKLTAWVRGRIWEERHAVDPNIPAPEKLEITPEAHAAMVARLFAEKFPAGTEFSAPLEAAPEVTANPAPAPKSLLRRVIDVVTFGVFSRPPNSTPEVPAAPASPVASSRETSAEGQTPDEMAGRLAESIPVDDNDLRALAAARAQRVRDYFLTEGKIAADRVFLAQEQGGAKGNKGPRVFLTLQ